MKSPLALLVRGTAVRGPIARRSVMTGRRAGAFDAVGTVPAREADRIESQRVDHDDIELADGVEAAGQCGLDARLRLAPRRTAVQLDDDGLLQPIHGKLSVPLRPTS